MLKKLGMVTIGVTAGLVAVAPMASATECSHGHHDSDHHKSSQDRGGKNNANGDCSFTGGEAGAGSDIEGNSLANAVTQAPVAGNNIGNIADCSSFLNDNLNDNFSGNDVALLGDNVVPDLAGSDS